MDINAVVFATHNLPTLCRDVRVDVMRCAVIVSAQSGLGERGTSSSHKYLLN